MLPEAARFVFHVGAGKCGSSAIQAAMSKQTSLGPVTGGRTAKYAVMMPSGEIQTDALIGQRAAVSAYGYASSVGITELSGPQSLDRAIAALSAMSEKGVVPFLSYEGFIGEHAAFREKAVFDRLGGGVEVLIYVRPQVAWLNSAFWQWGAWSDAAIERWIAYATNMLDWAALAEAWSDMKGVERVSVRLATRNVVTDIRALYNLDLPDPGRTNESLDGVALRLLQRQRQLRPGPHDSAIDFVIGRIPRTATSPVPWILKTKTVETVIERFTDSNRRLMALLDPEDRAAMEVDRHWWHPAAYADRPVEPIEQPTIDVKGLELLAADALAALLVADKENRLLREKLALAKSSAAPAKPQSTP